MTLLQLLRQLAFNMRFTATEMLKEHDPELDQHATELDQHATELVGAARKVDTWIAGLEERE